jgi:nitrogen-specific signal transduction histidine kinase
MKSELKKEFDSFVDAFQKLESPLHVIYERTRSIPFIIVRNNIVLFFNEKAREEFNSIFGVEIAIGMTISECFKNNIFTERLDEHFQKSLKGDRIIAENLFGTGEKKVWYKMDFQPILRENRTIAVSISIRNINEKKKKDLRHQEQNDLLNGIVFMLCHDIRGPVASILGLVNIIDKSGLSEKNNEIIGFLEIVSKNLDRIITEVVSDINNFTLRE